MEFGTGVIPEELLSFEDVKVQTSQVRALELQKLGVSDTDRTVTKDTLGATQRDDVLPPKFGSVIPAFAEVQYNQQTDPTRREKVEIVPVESIPELEGSRCIAFYGEPMRYRLAWDSWNDNGGIVYLWFDPIEDISSSLGSQDKIFPEAFWTLIVKKAALNVIRIVRMKALHIDKNDREELNSILSMFEASMIAQIGEWERQFQIWKNLDYNSGPRLRRTLEEIMDRSYDNVTGREPLDGGW